ncbi:MAG: NUDIX hydrolase [Clostridia bacterium]|nr:NUDIX hydrolase [Clostridia bacterium]
MSQNIYLINEIAAYAPCCEQEAADRAAMLDFLANTPDALLRSHLAGHVTASAWIVNPARDRVLFCWHNIDRSWSWVGGHADGESDLAAVALREAREETGLASVRLAGEGIFSLEILTVDGHEKRGRYVPGHLHYNLTYLLEADDRQPVRPKPDENSGVRWFFLRDAAAASTEPWMAERVYQKLIARTDKEL